MNHRPVTKNERNPEKYNRHLIPMQRHQSEHLISEHIATANYLLPTDLRSYPEKASDSISRSTAALWDLVIQKKLRYNNYIVLENFFLFEWLPRSPGLYHTDQAKRARQSAKHSIANIIDDSVIYDPFGKGSMIEGGVGNIRLKPIHIHGEEYFLVSASSSGVCHEGFPIALSSQLYDRYIDEIRTKGAHFCTLIGKLKFVPNEFSVLYHGYTKVPQLYLLVEEIKDGLPNIQETRSNLLINVAVSFFGRFQNKQGVYASYVNFNPQVKSSFQDSIDWMEQEYVGKMYEGIILTDFDQQEAHFSNAAFSLDKVMSRTIDPKDISKAEELGLINPAVLENQQRITIILQKGEIYMGNKYNISGGNQGAVGDNSQASNFSQNSNQSSINIENLVGELSKLREAAEREASDTEQNIAVGEIAAAESSAKNGDRNGVMHHLAKAGQWAFDVATKIGVVLAAEAIKQAMKP